MFVDNKVNTDGTVAPVPLAASVSKSTMYVRYLKKKKKKKKKKLTEKASVKEMRSERDAYPSQLNYSIH